MSITVVIPVYNEEKSIARCLISLQGQTTKPIEIVVVDDGSTDRTVALVKKFPVALVKQNHQGPGAAEI